MGAMCSVWKPTNSMDPGTRRRVVVITDNACYHHARLHRPWREQHAHQFALDFLPPCGPELNAIERVWKLTRRRCLHSLHNRCVDNLQGSSARLNLSSQPGNCGNAFSKVDNRLGRFPYSSIYSLSRFHRTALPCVDVRKLRSKVTGTRESQHLGMEKCEMTA
jgi:transposase